MLSTWYETPNPSASVDLPPALMIASCRAARLPALSGDSSVFSIPSDHITKRWFLSNTLLASGKAEQTDNKFVDIVEKISARLIELEWSWSDLARAMDITPERINNWKKRGVPASQIKHIATAIGIQRHQLEGDGSTQLIELTQEQIEVLALWELLIPSEREDLKRRAEHNHEVLTAIQPRVVKVSKAQTRYNGLDRRGKMREEDG